MASKVLRRLRPSVGGSPFIHVLFPPAGGSCSTCAPLAGTGAPGEVWGVEYPGRGARIDTPPADSLPALAVEVSAELPEVVGEDRLRHTVLVGISMGGFVAFETARRLPQPPAALVVAGVGAPTHGRMGGTELTDAELLSLMEEGQAARLREQPEVLEYALRTLRADMQMTGAYTGPESGRVKCHLVVIYGTDDPRLNEDSADSWRDWADVGFTTRELPGAHLDLLTENGSRNFWQTLAAVPRRPSP
jgi:surfactin synthase thioesterase subunit